MNRLESDIVLVDARFRGDFESGHFEEALNIPVNASLSEFRQASEGIAKKSKIVVYCHSAQCKFAEQISARLIKEGFTDVVVYQGGWTEWLAHTEDGKGAT